MRKNIEIMFFIKQTYKQIKKRIRRILVFIFIGILAMAGVPLPVAHSGGYEPLGVYQDLFFEVQDNLFTLPESLGYVQDVFLGTKDRFVIHIQDAHSNYYAQKTITEIIRYFKEKYGVSLICLEGGSGEYDLEPFENIQDDAIRSIAADFFLNQGRLNAAEFMKIKEPKGFVLAGIEDAALYKENLNIYKENIKHKHSVNSFLENTSRVMTSLKKQIYSSNLVEMDKQYMMYKNGEISFKTYLSYLIEQAGFKGLNIKNLSNLYLIQQIFDVENQIDFKKANKERDAFIERLRQNLARNKIQELVQKITEYKTGIIKQGKFYDYLLETGEKSGIAISKYPIFQKYIIYVSLYSAIDKSRVFKELNQLEDLIREELCSGEIQRKLMVFSKRFTLIEKAFDFTLTKDDYDHLLLQCFDSFPITEMTSFLAKQASFYGTRSGLPKNSFELDERLKQISGFYVCSFRRDEIFTRNTLEQIKTTGFNDAILITGGFHSENLTRLMREKDVSYISIMPQFKNAAGYTCPYFDLLSGRDSFMEKFILDTVASSGLQIASIWNRLGMELAGEKEKNLAMIQLEIVKTLETEPEAFLAIKGSEIAISFHKDPAGNIDYKLVRAQEDKIADVLITNADDLSYDDHEKIIDEQIVMARDRGDVNLFDPEKEIGQKMVSFLKAVEERGGFSGIAEAVENKKINIYEVKGAKGFRGHASWRGIYINAEIPAKEQTAVLVHEIGAYYRQTHKQNIELEKLYKKYDLSEAVLETADITKFGALKEQNELKGPGYVPGRDYANADIEYGERNLNVDFLSKREAEGTGKKWLNVISSQSGKIGNKMIRIIQKRSRNIPFFNAEAFGAFIESWDILTIEDNFYTAGFVDAEQDEYGRRKLYLTETLHNALTLVPEAVPFIILSEVSRSERENKHTQAILKQLISGTDITSPGIFMRGLSGIKKQAIKQAFEQTGADLTKLINLAEKIGKEKFSEQEKKLIRINQNNLRVGDEPASAVILGYGLINQLFAGYDDIGLMNVMRNMDGSHQSKTEIAEAMLKIKPRLWVCFADVMAGRAREKSMGSKIMDILSPEATDMAVNFARERGIFAYGFEKDEHAFVFPDYYIADDIKQFFLDMAEEMEKGSAYELYALGKGSKENAG
ncbi:MAG: hypothetical protein ABH869_02285 [Candidatus Omnitrophota bacterium]